MLDLQQIGSFLAVVRAGSFVAASNPTVTRTLFGRSISIGPVGFRTFETFAAESSAARMSVNGWW